MSSADTCAVSDCFPPMGHSRTFFIVTVILRSGRYSELHAGRLAGQQILFIETWGRASEQRASAILRRFCPFTLLFRPAPVLLHTFCFCLFPTCTHVPDVPSFATFGSCTPSWLLRIFEGMLHTLWPVRVETYMSVWPNSLVVSLCLCGLFK